MHKLFYTHRYFEIGDSIAVCMRVVFRTSRQQVHITHIVHIARSTNTHFSVLILSPAIEMPQCRNSIDAQLFILFSRLTGPSS